MSFILEGFSIQKTLYHSSNSTIFRAEDTNTKKTVVVKWIEPDNIPFLHSCLLSEFEISQRLKSPFVIQTHHYFRNVQGSILIMEDIDSISLKDYMNGKALNLSNFFPLALQMCDSLHAVHSKNIIHKDINPSNFLIHPKELSVKVIDFGISTFLPRSEQEAVALTSLEGTLPYISPEQTGRMNRPIDYRTDFYSLGISFYEMVTGKLPFESKDNLEMVHFHIAGKTKPLHEINPSIPPMLSAIVEKLIAKNAEDRYQSVSGIKLDLERCLNRYNQNGVNFDFAIAERDFSEKFLIPPKLYGRERETTRLLKAFEDMCELGHAEFLMVKGYSGIGKTSLIQEIHKPVIAKKGYFLSGKFDQFQKNSPYSALIGAFSDLISQILAEPAEKLAEWKSEILTALGNNGRAITNVIPELEHLIGVQPELPELGAQENQNRFQMVFTKYIRALSQRQHPMVIFLDDLQWTDSATLRLLHEIASVPDDLYLLILGAYRDNEVGEAHPLYLLFEELKEKNITIDGISLQPLNLLHIRQMLTETLHSSSNDLVDFAELLIRKTGGNPYFLTQFLKSLYIEGLINYDPLKSQWVYQLSKIEERGFTDNVVEFMGARLKELDISTRTPLGVASVVGNEFSLNVLVSLTGTDEKTLLKLLIPAVIGDLISGNKDIIKLSERDLDEIHRAEVNFQFVHDRVQQVCYQSFSEEERIRIHYKFGNLILNQAEENNTIEQIFSVVDHLNLSISILNDSEKEKLSKLNLQAGIRARENTAFNHAVEYLNTSLKLTLNPSPEFLYEVHLEKAITTQLLGNFEEMEKSIEICIQSTKNSLDRSRALKIRLMSLVSRNRLEEGLEEGFQMLSILNVWVPKHPGQIHVLYYFFKIKRIIRKLGGPENLLNIPPTNDPRILEIMEVFNVIIPIVYYIRPNLLPIFGLIGLEMSVKYGFGKYTGFFIFTLAHLLCNYLNKIEEGLTFVEIMYKFLDKIEDKGAQGDIYYLIKNFFPNLKSHYRDKMDHYDKCLQLGLEAGVFPLASWSVQRLYLHNFFLSESIPDILKKYQKYLAVLKQMNQMAQINITYCYLETYQLLSQKREIHFEDIDNIGSSLVFFENSKDKTALMNFYLLKAVLAMIFGFKKEGYRYIKNLEECREGSIGVIEYAMSLLYCGLLYLSDAEKLSKRERNKVLKKLKKYQDMLLFWASHCPDNYLNKWQILEAEKSRVLGKDREAVEYYRLAIESAKKSDFVLEIALSCELSGEYWFARSNISIGANFILESHRYYLRWGALAKTKQLEEKYRDIFGNRSPKSNTITTSTHTNFVTSSNTSLISGLDIASILKASQAISGEIKIKNLVNKLLQIIIENAGASRAVLIQLENNEMNVQAEASLISGKFEFYENQKVDKKFAPISILEYVKRTQKTIVLSNAILQGQFVKDSYIQENHTQSVLCAPIKKQDTLVAIIYLENSLTSGVFTEERLEVIKILSAQAAISYENAQLYSEMEDKVKERTNELQTMLTSIQKDLIMAKKIQNSILPSLNWKKNLFTVDYIYKPVEEIGGDFFHIAEQEDGRIRIILADATGHGIQAALVVMVIQGLYQPYKMGNKSPGEILEAINRDYTERYLQLNSFFTCVIMEIDPTQKKLYYASGGHPDLLLFQGKEYEKLTRSGRILGWSVTPYETFEREFTENSRVYLYTDGIFEEFNPEKEEFGEDRLISVILETIDKPLSEAIILQKKRLFEFMNGEEINDDITFAAIELRK